MTENVSTRLSIGIILLVTSAAIVAKGVYQVIEDHGVGRPSTFAFFTMACIAAVAPAFYGLRWLRGWRAWLVILLSLPMLVLLAVSMWDLVTHNVP